MSASDLLALVVDDDVMVRNLTMRALAREGFQCDAASDGNEALAMAGCTHYDAVVTDLKMPNMNGHALAVELLAQAESPVIFVLTAVTEPRLTKDLLQRGVSNVLTKPIEYPLLAAMVKQGTIEKAATHRSEVSQVTAPRTESSAQSVETAGACQVDRSDSLLPAIDETQFALGLSRIGQVMPASEAAINVYRMSQSGDFDSRDFARAIVKHKVLAAEVVQLANLPFYNPNRAPISHVDRGAIQIGQKRIGQFALAASALAAMMDQQPSALNTNAIWRRSVAAGMVLELLINRGGHQGIADGLLLCATVQELGRVLLATLYPTHYERAFLCCAAENRSIFEIEQTMFPKAQNEVMCHALEGWNIPSSFFQPLLHVHKNYEALALLPEPLRTQTELVKIAGQVSKIAIGMWQPWDHVEIPAGDAIDRLGPLSLATIVNETKSNVAGINAFGLSAAASHSAVGKRLPATESLSYYEASAIRFDFLATVLSSMELRLRPCRDAYDLQHRLVANCLGVRSTELQTLAGNRRSSDDVIIICEPRDADFYESSGRVVNVPTSYAALQQALRNDNAVLAP